MKVFYEQAFQWKFTDYGTEYTSFEDGRLSGGFHQGAATVGGTLAIIYAVDLEAMLVKERVLVGQDPERKPAQQASRLPVRFRHPLTIPNHQSRSPL